MQAPRNIQKIPKMIGISLLVMLTAQSLASEGRHEERPICSNTASVLKAAWSFVRRWTNVW